MAFGGNELLELFERFLRPIFLDEGDGDDDDNRNGDTDGVVELLHDD